MNPRIIAALRVLAAVLAVVGSFLPLYTVSRDLPIAEELRVAFSFTSWGASSGDNSDFPPLGVALVAPAAMLLLAVLLGLLGNRWNDWLATLGAGFLGGAVLMFGFIVVPQATRSQSAMIPVSIGLGFWLIVAATVAAVVAAVLGGRTAVPQESPAERTDPAIPIVHELPRDLET